MENILYINCITSAKRELIEEFLANGDTYLYKSFDIFTHEDTYLDFVEIDFQLDPLVICLKFENDFAMSFCNELAMRYKVNTRLCYFNKALNVAGKYVIHNGIIVCNVRYSYWFGLYIIDTDKFWENIKETFELFQTFENMVMFLGLNAMHHNDLNQLKVLFQDNLNVNFLNFSFQKL